MGDIDSVQPHTDPNASDTISVDRVPIVFVPGVMGSRIDMPSAGRTWDPDGLAMAAWLPPTEPAESSWRRKNRKALSPRASSASTLTELSSAAKKDLDGEPLCMESWKSQTQPFRVLDTPDDWADYHSFFGATRGWASVVWAGFYGKILMLLEGTLNSTGRHPVFAFGYDWRSSNDVSGAALSTFVANVISQVPGAQDVILVSHSMGGLVVRGALAGDLSLAAKVRGVVHGAQPSNGAVVCYRRFFTGCQKSLDGSGAVADWFLNRVMGNTPWDYAYNLSGCPGPLELLPNHIYQQYMGDTPWLVDPDTNPDLSDIYTVYKGHAWPGLRGPVVVAQHIYGTDDENQNDTLVDEFLANLDVAKGFHENAATVAHPNTFVALSASVATDTFLTFGSYTTAMDAAQAAIDALASNGGAGGAIGQALAANQQATTTRGLWTQPAMGPDNTDLVGTLQGSGDGTVPEVSARCPALTLAAPATVIPNLLHAAVYSDDTFNGVVVEYIRKLLALPLGGRLPTGS